MPTGMVSPDLRSKLPSFMLVAAVLLVAFVTGLFVSVGSKVLDFLMIGGMLGLAILAVKPYPMVAAQAIVACLIVGQLTYFARISQAMWIPYGLGILLYFRLPDAYLKSPFSRNSRVPVPLLFPVLVFMGLVAVSVFVSGTSALQAIVGGKNLLALWSVYFMVAFFAVTVRQVEKIIHWLIPLAFFQVPFVVYQYVFVAAQRSNGGGHAGLSWDAIVGSFGGDPLSGGASGVMAFALVSAMLLVIALWRKRQIKGATAIAVAMVATVCIVLAEVKAVFVLFPVGMAILFFSELRKHPGTFVAGVMVALLLMVGLLYAYESIHYATSGRASSSFSELFDRAFGYSFDTQLINYKTGEMGRMAAFTFWWQEGFAPDAISGLFGYGPGASRASTIAYGEVAQRYPFRIDRSAAVQMLWEIGLAGFMVFSFILLRASLLAYRLSKRCQSEPARQATLETISAVLFMTFLMSAYGKDLLEVPALSLFTVIALGYVSQVASLKNPRLTTLQRDKL